ncbi:MAG TPA: alpha-amylase family glycosyl hydrolase [Patescibacteria group bacterium]|nr:alpha-amylase family glycosyl hydrolase [Patescibacteria group bacterium]
MAIAPNWIKNASIYEIYSLTFRNGGVGGADVKDQDPFYGDLKGVRDELGYIQQLNMDALWLTPIYESPLKDGFGYNISNYKKIHPLLGSDQDFDDLVKDAHDRGLKVIMDLVFAHTSDQHEWFKQSRRSKDATNNPYADFYVWKDPVIDGEGRRQPPNNWRSMDTQAPGAWEWCEERQQYYLHYFNRSMPVLNLENEAVQEALLEVARFWLDRGVDGFRMDAVSHMGHDSQFRDEPVYEGGQGWAGMNHIYTTAQPVAKEFLKKLNAMLKARPDKVLPADPDNPYKPGLLGEVMGHPEFAAELVREGALDTAYTGTLMGNLANFRQIVEDAFKGGEYNDSINWAMTSHDSVRVLDRTFGESAKPQHAVLYAGMLASLPGSVCLFQGEELALRQARLADVKVPDPLGLNDSFMGEIDASRAALPWSDGANDKVWMKAAPVNKVLSPESQEGRKDSPLEQIRDLFALRKDSSALRDFRKPYFVETHNPEVMAYVRTAAEGKRNILCLFNFSSHAWKTHATLEGQVIDVNLPALDAVLQPFKASADKIPGMRIDLTAT